MKSESDHRVPEILQTINQINMRNENFGKEQNKAIKLPSKRVQNADREAPELTVAA